MKWSLALCLVLAGCAGSEARREAASAGAPAPTHASPAASDRPPTPPGDGSVSIGDLLVPAGGSADLAWGSVALALDGCGGVRVTVDLRGVSPPTWWLHNAEVQLLDPKGNPLDVRPADAFAVALSDPDATAPGQPRCDRTWLPGPDVETAGARMILRRFFGRAVSPSFALVHVPEPHGYAEHRLLFSLGPTSAPSNFASGAQRTHPTPRPARRDGAPADVLETPYFRVTPLPTRRCGRGFGDEAVLGFEVRLENFSNVPLSVRLARVVDADGVSHQQQYLGDCRGEDVAAQPGQARTFIAQIGVPRTAHGLRLELSVEQEAARYSLSAGTMPAEMSLGVGDAPGDPPRPDLQWTSPANTKTQTEQLAVEITAVKACRSREEGPDGAPRVGVQMVVTNRTKGELTMTEIAEVTKEGDHYNLVAYPDDDCAPALPERLKAGETVRGWVMFEQSPKATTAFHVTMTVEGPAPTPSLGQPWWKRAAAPRHAVDSDAGQVAPRIDVR